MADQVETDSRLAANRPPTPPAAPPTAGARGQSEGVSPFHVVKSGQGKHVRWGSAIGVGLLAFGGAAFSWEVVKRFTDNETLLRVVPAVVLLGLAYVIFRFLAQHAGIVDFMIATEGEMKKVNWSSRKEVWGATRIVIVTLFALAFVLALVDVVFILFFSGIGVLKFDVMRLLFRIGQEGA